MDQAQPLQASPSPMSPDGDSKLDSKTPVVRGARACTVCRQAKMKCVGADDVNGIPCQRCKRAGVECVFEKHRRGRKPGSRLSEASKMLRRLEKGLSNAKQKNTKDGLSLPPIAGGSFDARYRLDIAASSSRFPNNELPPLNLPPHFQDAPSGDGRDDDSDMDEDEEDTAHAEAGMYPARLIRKENQRHSSFFKTILNPQDEPARAYGSERSFSQPASATPPAGKSAAEPALPLVNAGAGAGTGTGTLRDPVEAGLVSEKEAHDLFDMFFIRMNQFINLFDPALHSVEYVRARCPFLFTALLMGACKFFKAELYGALLKLGHQFAVRAFAENWRRVEVVQAFACMTYWREPEDTRTWTYIGYACRMAVELGLNRHVGRRAGERAGELLERRNRERTYLVLFVHDRSLSMQTGKQWMLPECNLVKAAGAWHEEGGAQIRPEDVILGAFVQLRKVASEKLDVFQARSGVPGAYHGDMDTDILLRQLNANLDAWRQQWDTEMARARGEPFHFSFLRCFADYVRLFLNSFGVNTSPTLPPGVATNPRTLNTCYSSAMDHMNAVAKDFRSMSVLRYGQDSITVMTAYSAIFLLKLLRSGNRLQDLKDNAQEEIYDVIARTADAYSDAANLSHASTSAAFHARFLRSLVTNDLYKQRQQQPDDKMKRSGSSNGHRAEDRPAQYGAPPASYGYPAYPAPAPPERFADRSGYYAGAPGAPPQPSPVPAPYAYAREQEFSSPSEPVSPEGAYYGAAPPPPPQPYYAQYPAQPTCEPEAVYWRQMFKEVGMGDGSEQAYMAGYQGYGPAPPVGIPHGAYVNGAAAYGEAPQQQPPQQPPQQPAPEHAYGAQYHYGPGGQPVMSTYSALAPASR